MEVPMLHTTTTKIRAAFAVLVVVGTLAAGASSATAATTKPAPVKAGLSWDRTAKPSGLSWNGLSWNVAAKPVGVAKP